MPLFLVALAGEAVTVAPGCCFPAAPLLLRWQSTEHSPHPGPVGQCAVVRSLGKVQLRAQLECQSRCVEQTGRASGSVSPTLGRDGGYSSVPGQQKAGTGTSSQHPLSDWDLHQSYCHEQFHVITLCCLNLTLWLECLVQNTTIPYLLE